MEQKLLLCGSIIAVVVLVLAGLSPVVSFTTANSSAVSSPLFQVRTQRAVEQDSSGLNCAYIGQGDTFLLPRRDSNIKKLQLVVERIQGMDDDTFNWFVEQVAYRYQIHRNEMKTSFNEMITVLYQIRDNPEVLYEFEKDWYLSINGPPRLCQFISNIVFILVSWIGFFMAFLFYTILIGHGNCESAFCVPTTGCHL
jgi:hypothetical protein